jgi:hypothetical protein
MRLEVMPLDNKAPVPTWTSAGNDVAAGAWSCPDKWILQGQNGHLYCVRTGIHYTGTE